jgi:DNA recombination-dependent growth factor C
MGLMSSSVSLSRFRVEGNLSTPVLGTVENGLKANAISEISDETVEKAVGWTSFQRPYQASFQNRDFVIGPYVVFSLRIDKKSIPSKVFQKQFAEASRRRLTESGRPYLSRSEKKMLRDEVAHQLILRIPAVPNVYDLVWSIEGQTIWFFTTLKSANEELESLFARSFHLTLIRLFPFTMADLTAGLNEAERDILSRLTPTAFAA